MNVEIINVGTELLLGEIVNTNATYLQKMCKELGFNVYHQSVVGDNPDRLKECLKIAFDRGADCVITTGGLGPTQDDLTKELSAEFLGLEMELLDEEVEKVKAKCQFLSGRKEIRKNNLKQARFPQNCFILDNEVGTANGCVMQNEKYMIINLPGPPKEMKYVVDHVLVKYLQKYQKDAIYSYDYITMGIGESKVDEILKNLIHDQTDVSIALYASEETVRVRLACKARNQKAADDMMQETKQIIEAELKEFIIKEKNLKDALIKILPPYRLEYRSDFRLRDEYLLSHPSDDADLLIIIDKKCHSVGEIIMVTLQDGMHQRTFEIPLLKKAELSYSKLEARITSQLYAFLRQHI